jgi:hypothetical protein
MPTNIFDMLDLWNNNTVTWNAIKMNVNNQAATPESQVLDLQVNGISQFGVHFVNGIQIGLPTGGYVGPGSINASSGYYIDGVSIFHSPVFDGDPQAPTPPFGDNDTSIPTTFWVHREFAPIASPVFTGDPKAPTPAVGDNDTSIATTAFATAADEALRLILVALINLKAPINNPVFTGDPQAPTPPPNDNDTSIPTTAWVQTELFDYALLNSPVFVGTPRAPTPAPGDSSPLIATTAFVTLADSQLRNEYTNLLNLKANINSPTFTGDPQAPTPAPGDNDTSIATTAFVKSQDYATHADLTPYAPLNSPIFIGDPRAPTPSPADNDTSIATTAFVKAQGYILSGDVAANFQPLDADLTALAGLTQTNSMFYRSAANTWAPVSIGANMSFVGGVLASTGGSGGTGAPTDAEYIVSIGNAGLSAERVLTDSPSIVWDRSIPGQILANTAAGGGNVSSVGAPVLGQWARWTTTSTIEGVNNATVLSAIGAQPLDGDLTALAALVGTNTIYYRSGNNTWTPVTIGGNLTFAGGILDGTPAGTPGGNVSSAGTPAAGQLAQWVDSTHIQGIAATSYVTEAPVDSKTYGRNNNSWLDLANLFAPVASPVFTGNPTAPTASLADNDTTIATTAFVKGQGYGLATDISGKANIASPVFTGDPQAPTPATADNDNSIATTAFVKANLATFAPVANPIFTGDPQAPTPATADNDTSIATTAFVKAQNYLTQTLANTLYQPIGSYQPAGNYVRPDQTGTISVGYTINPANLGTIASQTLNPALGNYQFGNNNGPITLTAPTADCAIDIMVTNGATAGAITFSGFTVGSNVGDALTTASGAKFVISVRRIGGTATYTLKALQ